MQSEEQRLIDGLFDRLQQAQNNSAARDGAAESRINEHLQRQPAAPYYMAQTILIQEAAVKQLNARIQELESKVSELEQARPASGGFLAGLFGGGQQSAPARQSASARPYDGSAPIPGASHYQSAAPGGYSQPAAPQPQAARGGGFMAGALQTAAGVAGGVVLGNMLTGMFQHSRPQEIVNIINEPDPTQQTSDAASTAADSLAGDNAQSDDAFQDASFTQDDGGGWMDFGGDDFGADGDFGGDDDSWI